GSPPRRGHVRGGATQAAAGRDRAAAQSRAPQLRDGRCVLDDVPTRRKAVHKGRWSPAHPAACAPGPGENGAGRGTPSPPTAHEAGRDPKPAGTPGPTRARESAMSTETVETPEPEVEQTDPAEASEAAVDAESAE